MKYEEAEQLEPERTDPLDFMTAVPIVVLCLGSLLLIATVISPGDSTLFIFAFIGSLIYLFWAVQTENTKGAYFGLTLAVGSLLFAVFGPSAERQVQPRQSVCMNNLRNLGQALQHRVTTKEYFPAAFTVDQNGNRLHSWRTLLLPYFDRNDLFERVDLKQPWNSPRNRFLGQTEFELMRCPSDTNCKPGETSYVAIIGPGTVWEKGKRIGPHDIRDGLDNTILLVEMKNSGIAWAEPRDLDLEDLPPGITTANLLTSLSNHPGGFMALFASGRTEFVNNTIPWAQFKAMLTINGKD